MAPERRAELIAAIVIRRGRDIKETGGGVCPLVFGRKDEQRQTTREEVREGLVKRETERGIRGPYEEFAGRQSG